MTNNNATNMDHFKNLNLLFIEDNPIVSEEFSNIFNIYFHNVYYTNTAEEALKLFEKEKIDVLITDVILPGMNGIDLCHKIRKKNPQIAIIIITAYDKNDFLKKAIKLNLIDYLIKPISYNNIKTTLMETLEWLNKNDVYFVKITDKITYKPLVCKLDIEGRSISLTKMEAALLDLLLQNKNRIVSHDLIKETIYPEEYPSEAAYKSLVFRLRTKISKDVLTSVYGEGLKLARVLVK